MNLYDIHSNDNIRRIISNVALFFMLTARLSDGYFTKFIFGNNEPNWFNNYYSCFVYIIMALLVWLNKSDLDSLNIDSGFVNIMLFSGVLLVFYLPLELGAFICILVGFFYLAIKNNQIYVKKSSKYTPWMWLLVLASIGVALLPVWVYMPSAKSIINIQSIIDSFFQAQLTWVVLEEFIFRGTLWAFLKRLKLHEYAILFIQAIFFWISHYKYLFLHNPYGFWVPGPILALSFGFLVLRSKSLMPSTISHFLFNFASQIILHIY